MSPLAGTVVVSVLTVFSGARNDAGDAFSEGFVVGALDCVEAAEGVEKDVLLVEPPHPASAGASAAIAMRNTKGLSKASLLYVGKGSRRRHLDVDQCIRREKTESSPSRSATAGG